MNEEEFKKSFTELNDRMDALYELNEINHTMLESLKAEMDRRLADKQAEELADAMKEVTKFTDSMRTLIKELYTSARTYTTVVIGGGYAAAFALWSHLKVTAPSQAVAFCAACLLISVVVFVCSEVASVVKISHLNFGIQRLKPKDVNLDSQMEYVRDIGKQFEKFAPTPWVYYTQVILAIGPAIVAAGIMLWLYSKSALALP